jgi:hypothetical protein
MVKLEAMARLLEAEGTDRSTSDTVVQYAVQFQFKGKSPSAAAKATAAKLSGHTNMFLGSGVTVIDPKKLEQALWDNMVDFALAGAKHMTPGKEYIAAKATAYHFRLSPRMEEKLAALVAKRKG